MNEKYTYKKLVCFTLYIFFALIAVLIGYVCIKVKYHHETPFKENCILGFLNKNLEISNRLSSLSKWYQHCKSRVSTYIYTVCPSITKTKSYQTTATNNNTSNNANVSLRTSNGIYTRASTALDVNIDSANLDDDRLNLAECQVYDETVLNEYLYHYKHGRTESDDLQSANNNPYKSLTVKS